jgi:peptidoglycan hydrolase-like protein with peptidoglycan-binding domain
VRKLATRYGPRWEVYPVKARNSLATFITQTDFLGATVQIPAAQRTPGEMLELITQQLTRAWGRRFWVGSDQPFSSDVLVSHTAEMGADNISARQAIVDLMGPRVALRMFYGPDDGSYAINIVSLPYQPPPRPPTPAAVPATVLPPGPRPPGYWLARARTPDGILEIQGGLVEAGYLHTPPTTQWDAEATAALRQFQAALGLPPTGKFDYSTAWKLAPFLPQYQRVVPAKGPMDPELAYWLGSTRRGWIEIQEALTKASFYTGPPTGAMDVKTREALSAFQTANGLMPNGAFDYQTAEKLAPFLPKSN